MSFRKKIHGNKFLASFAVLASGSIVAQLISIASSPITTRLFSPSQFGKYTMIATAVSIFGPIISLKYDMMIVASDDIKESNTLVKLSFFVTIFLSLIIGITYGNFILTDGFQKSEKIIYAIVIIILLFSYGVNNILLAHNNRNSLYGLISTVTVIKTLVSSILMIVFGLLGLGVGGLVSSQIFSSFAGTMRQFKGIQSEIKDIAKIKISEQKKVFIKYVRQPLYNSTSALITTSVYSSINIFIKVVYSYELLGLYSLSYRVLGIPFSIISANLSRIFFDAASKEKKEKNNFQQIYRSTLKLLIITIIPTMIAMAALSPLVFSLLFGKEWVEAGYFVRLLTPMFAVRLISDSLVTTFIIAEKQEIELIIQISLFLGELIIFILAYLFSYDIELSLILISVLYVIIYLIAIFIMNNLSKRGV